MPVSFYWLFFYDCWPFNSSCDQQRYALFAWLRSISYLDVKKSSSHLAVKSIMNESNKFICAKKKKSPYLCTKQLRSATVKQQNLVDLDFPAKAVTVFRAQSHFNTRKWVNHLPCSHTSIKMKLLVGSKTLIHLKVVEILFLTHAFFRKPRQGDVVSEYSPTLTKVGALLRNASWQKWADVLTLKRKLPQSVIQEITNSECASTWRQFQCRHELRSVSEQQASLSWVNCSSVKQSRRPKFNLKRHDKHGLAFCSVRELRKDVRCVRLKLYSYHEFWS